jgi:hypothetical protein
MNTKQLAALITFLIVVLLPMLIYYLGEYDPIGVGAHGIDGLGQTMAVGFLNLMVGLLIGALIAMFGVLIYFLYIAILNKIEGR